MVWGIVALVIGIAYGWWKPGKQDKWAILKTGFIVGLVLAVLFALIGAATGANPLGLATVDAVGLLVAVVVITILFTLGVIIGDWIEGRSETRPKRVT